MYSYILITAAHNEEVFIENTIKSVIDQTILPVKWIIVSDRSTDKTDEIILKYTYECSFISFLKIDGNNDYNFAAKVNAIMAGYETSHNLKFDFIGILDADITFENFYYQKIIERFFQDNKLGIAGGKFYDLYAKKKESIPISEDNVRGAVQFFRKQCFEEIGGLLPLKYGGEDGMACFSARKNGWEVKSFNDLVILHHRRTGTAKSSILKKRIRDGLMEYSMGYHPLFQLIKCSYRIIEKPYLLGSILRFMGYWYGYLKAEKLIIPKDLIKFIRKDQLKRIFN
jgi:glycosyltransferase involved in cell wall biosynthesis